MAKSKNNSVTTVFSEKTAICLRLAGWSPTREVPLGIYETAFAEENLTIPTKVQSFLRHFGGLIIPYKNLAQQDDTIDFLAEEAVQGLGNQQLRSYDALVGGGHLCPIGHYAFGSCLLLMSSTGNVYGGQDMILYFVGNSGPQALENLVTGRHLEPMNQRSTPTAAEG